MQFLKDLTELLRWWDIVDILVIAVLVYNILLFIRGTRASQVLTGLFFLGGLYWLSGIFEVRTVHVILNHMFGDFFIILFLLFQNDIRRVLSQVGKTSLWPGADALKEGQFIEELVKGCVSLSNKKIGALIVLEKNASVLDFIEPGTILDSAFSRDVLISLFLPVSPLHDGAIILRDGKIHMAGCFLPLTLNASVSKSLGTRHRAALGLTEETDCFCIVVSEENGSISLASQGKITYDMDSAELRKYLLGLS